MSRPNRRELFGGAIAVAAVPATLGAAEIPPRLDPSSPADLSLIFRKLAYAADKRIGFWWLEGRRCALVETALIPLWDMHIGTVFRTRDLGDRRFEVTLLQTSFYTDLSTGEPIRTFDNPLTRKTVEIPRGPPVAARIAFDGQGRTDPPTGPLANLTRDARIGPAWIQGDHVWVQGDIVLEGQGAPGVRPIRVNDLTTYFGSARDILDPGMAMPLAGQMFCDINIWPPWLEMGDRKGDYFSRCYGRKVASFDAMPAVWRQSMLREFPAVATNFAKALDSR